MMRVLKLSTERALTSEMPSCVKSFVLPFAFLLTVISDNDALLVLLQNLFSGESQHSNVGAFLAKWIEYTTKIPNGRAKEIFYLG